MQNKKYTTELKTFVPVLKERDFIDFESETGSFEQFINTLAEENLASRTFRIFDIYCRVSFK